MARLDFDKLNSTLRYTMWSVFQVQPGVLDDDRAAAIKNAKEFFAQFDDTDVIGPRHLQRRRHPRGRRLHDLDARRAARGSSEAATPISGAPPTSAGPARRCGRTSRCTAPQSSTRATCRRSSPVRMPGDYVCVYPFVRSYEWYLLPDAERRKMLADHGKAGRGYPDVRANTVPCVRTRRLRVDPRVRGTRTRPDRRSDARPACDRSPHARARGNTVLHRSARRGRSAHRVAALTVTGPIGTDGGPAPPGARFSQMAHWGMYSAEVRDGEVVAAHPYAGDADPSPILQNIPGSVRHRSRITGPAIRRGWLEHGPGPSTDRGSDEFVAVSWDELTELLATELTRVAEHHGNRAIFGGSYGWSSPGRFHHAQSQVHRFLKMFGGYTRSVHSYSLGATGVIMPRVVGAHWKLFARSTNWDVIARETDLLVCFGGVPLKNTGVNDGGTSDHPTRGALDRMRARGGQHRVDHPAARRPPRRARVAGTAPGHRCRDHAGARLRPRVRRSGRSRVPGPLLHRIRPVRGVPARPHRRCSQDTGMGCGTIGSAGLALSSISLAGWPPAGR